MRMNAAVIGLGYWGPNLARNLSASNDFALAAFCERDSNRPNKLGVRYSAAQRFTDVDEMLRLAKPKLVCIATPVSSTTRSPRKPFARLERVEVPNPVPPEMRTCPLCGTKMTTVGHSRCENLNVVPARVFVQVRVAERVPCPKDDTIVCAPTPPAIVERGKLGDTLIVEATCDKYLEHTPIERQCTRLSRMGVDVALPVRTVSVKSDTASCCGRRSRPCAMATKATPAERRRRRFAKKSSVERPQRSRR